MKDKKRNSSPLRDSVDAVDQSSLCPSSASNNSRSACNCSGSVGSHSATIGASNILTTAGGISSAIVNYSSSLINRLYSSQAGAVVAGIIPGGAAGTSTGTGARTQVPTTASSSRPPPPPTRNCTCSGGAVHHQPHHNHNHVNQQHIISLPLSSPSPTSSCCSSASSSGVSCGGVSCGSVVSGGDKVEDSRDLTRPFEGLCLNSTSSSSSISSSVEVIHTNTGAGTRSTTAAAPPLSPHVPQTTIGNAHTITSSTSSSPQPIAPSINHSSSVVGGKAASASRAAVVLSPKPPPVPSRASALISHGRLPTIAEPPPPRSSAPSNSNSTSGGSTTTKPLETSATSALPPPPVSPRRDSNTCPAKRPLRLKNHSGSQNELYDVLHTKETYRSQHEKTRCSDEVCLGSVVSFTTPRPPGTPRALEDVKRLAKDFFDQYYTSIKRFNSTSHSQRWEQVERELDETGTYELTETELVYGAKLAWRNSVRCIGRIQWAKLQVFDARSVTTTSGMFEALCKHIKFATNRGNIRSAITVFPQRTNAQQDFRVWNPQLISYAGYKNPDGTITGDPNNVELTEVCEKLGWQGPRTRWDVLPLVLSANGNDPDMFEIPPELILEVRLTHPEYDWLPEMDLRWYALPAVSGMLFDCGGLEFTGAPFNGWYMGTEIGCRDLGDVHRYNVLEDLATRMGLDTRNPTTLWKDKAIVELNLAVLHSFQQEGVTIVDHHSASESFMKHYENELKTRGGCPADWVWIVPPMSGSATPVFHMEMAVYHLKPSYEYQELAWRTHVWKKNQQDEVDGNGSGGPGGPKRGVRRKFHFKEIARAVKFTSKLFGKALSKRIKATILYATETGKSELFARRLGEILGHAFNAQVYRMDEYDFINIEHEALILVVTSTFGNGDPPENGEAFANSLYAMRMNQGFAADDEYNMQSSKSFIKMNSQTDSVTSAERKFDRNDSLRGSQLSDIMSDDTLGPLKNITFAVFGLGSSAYPNFASFGRYVDNLLGELGGERLMKLMCGDELNGQDLTFRSWATEVFKVACDSFCLDMDSSMSDITSGLQEDSISPDTIRLTPATKGADEMRALSKLLGRKLTLYNMVSKTDLHSSGSSRITINVVLRKQAEPPLAYSAGDHIGVLASNRTELVDSILNRLVNKPKVIDQPVQLEKLVEKHTPMGLQKQWNLHERLPVLSLRHLLTKFLDITTPPRPDILTYLSRTTESSVEKDALNRLAEDPDEYEHWKNWLWPDLATVLELFPGVKPDAAVICAMLPPLQPRFYSVSSSPMACPDEVHLTVAVVTYKTKGGDGPTHFGVCSNYLHNAKPGTAVPCFVRRAPGFHMPSDLSRPIIMIGPGTGIAPFRGFWQQRKVVTPSDPIGKSKLGRLTLFFGCQTKEMILYRTELEELKRIGIFSDIYLALSREPKIKKTYVQDLLIREGESMANQILKQGGHIYVCGDCTMAEDVYQTLKAIVQEKGEMNDTEVENYMLSLRDDNRYHEDIFGITHRTAEVVEQVRRTALTRIESNYAISQANSPTAVSA